MDWAELEGERKRLAALRLRLVTETEAAVARWEWSVDPLHAVAGPRLQALSPARAGKALRAPPKTGRYRAYGWSEGDRLVLLRYFTPDQDLQSHTVLEHRRDGRVVVVVDPKGKILNVAWQESRDGRVVLERTVREGSQSETRYAYDGDRLVGFDDEFRSADGTRTVWKHIVAKGTAKRIEEIVERAAFDLPRFKATIASKVAAAFAKRPARVRRETLYAVVLFVNGESGFGYAALSLNTEEALVRAAKTEEQRSRLRWSTADWAYHDCARSFDQLVFPTEPTKAIDTEIYKAMLAALRPLRAVLGPKVVLNVVCGDMSSRFFRRGLEALNSKALAAWALRFPMP